MGDRPNIESGLVGADPQRKEGFFARTVAVDEAHARAGGLGSMQDDEAGAVGEKVGKRPAVGFHGQAAGRVAANAHRVGEAAPRLAAQPVIVDGEAGLVLSDVEVGEDGLERAPGIVAGEVVDGAHDLDATEADVAQIAVFEHGGQRAGDEAAALRRRLLRAEEFQRADAHFAFWSTVKAFTVFLRTSVRVSSSKLLKWGEARWTSKAAWFV